MMERKLRVALLCDSPDEGWHSMDLVGSMLASQLGANHWASIECTQLAFPIRRIFSNTAGLGERGFSADRVVHRLGEYPLRVALQRNRYDLFHIIDHSYSQLANYLPSDRTIVTCHDLDTFDSVLEPGQTKRSGLFRAMTKHILRGFQRVARVICDSAAVRSAVIERNLLSERTVEVAPLGPHPSCSPLPDRAADALAAELLRGERGTFYLLHVGSTIPRKRIDVLLKAVHGLRRKVPELRLLRVGGAFTAAQENLARDLGLDDCIDVLPFLNRETLAGIYRRADLLLMPSDAEGFGLPVLEALACGTPVVSSDLPVLREVGGSGVLAYCAPGKVEDWVNTLTEIFREREIDPDWRRRCREQSLAWAQRFSWQSYANRMVEIYSEVYRESGFRRG